MPVAASYALTMLHAVDTYITPSMTERRRLLAAIGIEVREPGEAELLRIVRRYLGERAEALLAVGSPVAQPVRGVADLRLFKRAASTFAGVSSRICMSGDQRANGRRARPPQTADAWRLARQGVFGGAHLVLSFPPRTQSQMRHVRFPALRE